MEKEMSDYIEEFKHFSDEWEFHRNLKESCGERMKNDDDFAHEVYQALCNMRWRKAGNMNYLKSIFSKGWNSETIYSCTWRYAGGLVAEIREKGEDYLDFYCSGDEGKVSERVRGIFWEMGDGWVEFPWNHWNQKIVDFYIRIKIKVQNFIEGCFDS